MVEIRVDVEKMRKSLTKLENISNDLPRIHKAYNKLQTRLDWDVAGEERISQRMLEITKQMQIFAGGYRQYAAALKLIADEYETTEASLLLNEQPLVDPSSKTVSPYATPIIDLFFKLFNQSIYNLKYVGGITELVTSSAFSAIDYIESGQWRYGDSPLGNITELQKDAFGAFKDVLDIKKYLDDVRLSALLGKSIQEASLPLASWTDRLGVSFWESANGSWKGLFKLTGIIDTALSIANNSIENFTEEKDDNGNLLSTERAWAETITETVFDVTKTFVIGTAVAAGVGAVGLAGAPAIAVTAVAIAAISISLDAVSGEDGFSEKYSDKLIDLGIKSIDYINANLDEVAGNVNSFNRPHFTPQMVPAGGGGSSSVCF